MKSTDEGVFLNFTKEPEELYNKKHKQFNNHQACATYIRIKVMSTSSVGGRSCFSHLQTVAWVWAALGSVFQFHPQFRVVKKLCVGVGAIAAYTYQTEFVVSNHHDQENNGVEHSIIEVFAPCIG